MAMVARQFDLVCDRLEQIDAFDFHALTPLAVNSAFTCELYLKLLYYISNPTRPKRLGRDGHDLHSLYNGQDLTIRHSIYQEYEKLFCERRERLCSDPGVPQDYSGMR